MPNDPTTRSKRVLQPDERIAEVLFGLIMVLTFTGSLSVAEADRAEVRTMLIGALGCNTVWGIIDGVLYLLGSLAEKGRGLRIRRAVRQAADPQSGQRLIADALPAVVVSVLQPDELEAMRERLAQLPESSEAASLDWADWQGAAGVFLWVFLSTFPVVVPFLLMHDVGIALRLSDGIAVAMLFLTGYAYGKCVARHPWLTGISMVALGSILVGLTMALGG